MPVHGTPLQTNNLDSESAMESIRKSAEMFARNTLSCLFMLLFGLWMLSFSLREMYIQYEKRTLPLAEFQQIHRVPVVQSETVTKNGEPPLIILTSADNLLFRVETQFPNSDEIFKAIKLDSTLYLWHKPISLYPDTIENLISEDWIFTSNLFQIATDDRILLSHGDMIQFYRDDWFTIAFTTGSLVGSLLIVCFFLHALAIKISWHRTGKQ